MTNLIAVLLCRNEMASCIRTISSATPILLGLRVANPPDIVKIAERPSSRITYIAIIITKRVDKGVLVLDLSCATTVTHDDRVFTAVASIQIITKHNHILEMTRCAVQVRVVFWVSTEYGSIMIVIASLTTASDTATPYITTIGHIQGHTLDVTRYRRRRTTLSVQEIQSTSANDNHIILTLVIPNSIVGRIRPTVRITILVVKFINGQYFTNRKRGSRTEPADSVIENFVVIDVLAEHDRVNRSMRHNNIFTRRIYMRHVTFYPCLSIFRTIAAVNSISRSSFVDRVNATVSSGCKYIVLITIAVSRRIHINRVHI